MLACLAVAATIAPAQAHPSPVSTLTVVTDGGRLVLDARIPLDRYELATGSSIEATDDGIGRASAGVAAYVQDHVDLEVGGVVEPVSVNSVHLGSLSGYPSLDVDLGARPAADPSDGFRLSWGVVTDEVPSHKVYVTMEVNGRKRLVDVLTAAHPTFDTKTTGTADGGAGRVTEPAVVGFSEMVRLGLGHIAGGYDHLLFLTMLLLPAPLFVRRRRRREGRAGAVADLAATARRVALVASAFTLGHSLTLAAVSLHLVRFPDRPVETLVAVSIVVAAAHAVRPVLARGEVAIAAGFGLVHGTAFATTILDLGLDTGDTLKAVLGFNVGIEVAQLIAIAAVVPLLHLASASREYRYLLLTVCALGSVAATDFAVAVWRSGDPVLQPVFALLSARPAFTWVALAAVCGSLWLTRGSEPWFDGVGWAEDEGEGERDQVPRRRRTAIRTPSAARAQGTSQSRRRDSLAPEVSEAPDEGRASAAAEASEDGPTV